MGVLSLRNPSWTTALNYCDEIFYTCQLFVERFYLQNYDSSFSENFYTLRRSSTSGTGQKENSSLTRAQRWRSLAFLVLIPYIKCKLDAHFKRISGRDEGEDGEIGVPAPEPEGKFSKLIHKMLVILYPYFNLIYEGTLLVYQIGYMHDFTRYYDWFLHLQGIEIKRMLLPELMEQQKRIQTK